MHHRIHVTKCLALDALDAAVSLTVGVFLTRMGAVACTQSREKRLYGQDSFT
jgi:hypothetical protein